MTVSGSGTNYVITLAKPIANADRVTITIGNAQIATYTRRLDILPGDVNDDGAVNTTDGVLVLNGVTKAYQIFEDANGDGIINTADFTLDRAKIGTVLPAVQAQGSLSIRLQLSSDAVPAPQIQIGALPAPGISSVSDLSVVTDEEIKVHSGLKIAVVPVHHRFRRPPPRGEVKS